MRLRPSLPFAAIAVSLLVAVSACGSSSGSGAADEGAVKIGLLGNLTGSAAPSFGLPFQRGFDLALADAQPVLEAAGVTVELLVEDAKSEVASAVTGYNKLKQQGAVVVVNDSQSPLGQAVAPLANDDSIAFLSGAGSKLENANGFAFRFTDLSTPTLGMGTYLVEGGAERIGVVVAGDNPSFATLAEVTESGLPDGYASRQEVSSADTDFSAVLANLRADKVDAVVLSVLPAQAGNILLQMQNAGGFEDVIKVGTVAVSGEAHTVAGAAADGFVFPQVWAPEQTSPGSFQVAYEKDNGSKPTAYGALGYQTAWILVAAIIAGAEKGEVSGTTVRDALPAASTSDTVTKAGILDLKLNADGSAASAGLMAEFNADGDMVAVTANG